MEMEGDGAGIDTLTLGLGGGGGGCVLGGGGGGACVVGGGSGACVWGGGAGACVWGGGAGAWVFCLCLGDGLGLWLGGGDGLGCAEGLASLVGTTPGITAGRVEVLGATEGPSPPLARVGFEVPENTTNDRTNATAAAMARPAPILSVVGVIHPRPARDRSSSSS